MNTTELTTTRIPLQGSSQVSQESAIEVGDAETSEMMEEDLNHDLSPLARGMLVDEPSMKKLNHWDGSTTQLAYIKK